MKAFSRDYRVLQSVINVTHMQKVERSEKVVLKGVFKHYIFKFAEPVFYKKQFRFP